MANPIQLPKPERGRAHPVLETLAKRCTTREMVDEPLSHQQLANLLWAACGVNRRAGPFGAPGRTAASASNSQEIDLYVALREAAFRYDALANRLDWIYAGDLRGEGLTPGQKASSSKGAVQLIYVVDVQRLTHSRGFDEPGLHDEETQKAYYFVDTGLIAGNVYLYAAAVGLAAWFHNCDRAKLAQYLGLGPQQRVLFAQSVGFPEQED